MNNNLEPKKTTVNKPDNTNKQLVLVGVVTVILLVIAVFVYINRQNNKPAENKDAEQKMTLEEALQKNKERDKKAQEEREAKEKEKESEENSNSVDSDDHFNQKGVDAKVEETTQNTTDSSTYVNTYCDMNLTVASRYKKYVNYITISALDSNGCALENSKENATYIRDRSFRAYNLAMEHQKSFTNETVRKSGSIKPDQITVQNTDGNIIGWVQILVYGDGVSSGTYAYTKDGKWEYLG